jgi:hypothetical protein
MGTRLLLHKKNHKMMKTSKSGFLMKIVEKLQILIKFDSDNFSLSEITVFFRKNIK